MEGPGTEVLNERVKRMHGAIDRGMRDATNQLVGMSSRIPGGVADRMRQESEAVTRAADRNLDGSLEATYKAVEKLTAHPWDSSPERAAVVSRTDDALRAWGVGHLDDLIKGSHDGDTIREIERAADMVRDASRGGQGEPRWLEEMLWSKEAENREWAETMNAAEDRQQKPIMAEQLADPDFGRGGPDQAEFEPDDYSIERRMDAEHLTQEPAGLKQEATNRPAVDRNEAAPTVGRPLPGRGEPLASLNGRVERARDSASSISAASQQSGGTVDGLPGRSIDEPPQGIARRL